MPIAPKTLAEIVDNATTARRRHQAELDKFTENLKTDAPHAFAWGGAAMTAAVRLRAIDEIVDACRPYTEEEIAAYGERGEAVPTDETRIGWLVEHYRREGYNMATRIASSSSAMSNMVDEEKRVTVNRIYGYLSGDGMMSGGF